MNTDYDILYDIKYETKRFDEQTECLRANKKVPNRMDEIPNMNEFKRYGEYQLQKKCLTN